MRGAQGKFVGGEFEQESVQVLEDDGVDIDVPGLFNAGEVNSHAANESMVSFKDNVEIFRIGRTEIIKIGTILQVVKRD